MRVPAMAPEAIRVSADRGMVTLSRAGAAPAVLRAGALRAACNCAGCRRAAIAGTAPTAPPDVAIAQISLMGGNAVNIAFSDGHDRGVFPWDLLWSLAQPAATPTKAEA